MENVHGDVVMDEGAKAWAAGVLKADCPYGLMGTEQHRWFYGWELARESCGARSASEEHNKAIHKSETADAPALEDAITKQGADAYAAGKGTDECIYHPQSPGHGLWRQGWRSANAADLKRTSVPPDDEVQVMLGPDTAEHPLLPVLLDVIRQVTRGKGKRHGGDAVPFLEQPWKHYADMHGRGFLTGQAAKKLEEAASTRDGEAFVNEMLGAIAYCGMAILYERSKKSTCEDAFQATNPAGPWVRLEDKLPPERSWVYTFGGYDGNGVWVTDTYLYAANGTINGWSVETLTKKGNTHWLSTTPPGSDSGRKKDS